MNLNFTYSFDNHNKMSQPQTNKTLNVTWDDHLQNLSGLFQDLYENKKLCDVTLYCSGGTLLKAHKIVLSACSPYFSKIFQEIEIKHPVIILKGVTYDEMHQLLEFMYKGSINILEHDLASLIQAGSYLEIKGMDAKNIPTNIKNNLKRTAENSVDENAEAAKKLKDINHEVAKITEQISRDTSPASSSRRETRFKGQKRVDVRFRSSRAMLTSSPVPAAAVAKKKDADEEKDAVADDPKVNDDIKTPIKGKSPKKSLTSKKDPFVSNEKESIENKTKSPPEKKPKTENVDISKEVKENTVELKIENKDSGVSNIIIKDVYSTVDSNSTLKENDENSDENDEEEDDEIYSELEDDSLVIPDVSFKETDGEITVTQSDDETGQNADATTEHLNVSYMECSYCSMTFKNDNDLFCHQKVHTETKPFKCDFCDTFFQRSSHLARHRRKHIGDRPYECKTCGKAFSRSDKLRTHCRQTHDDDYKPPPHLKKKYEFVEFTGDLMEKKGRGRPRKFPMKEPPKTPIDGQKRGRGRPRKMSCPAPGEPVENYDITNLPFGDFSYLTESFTLQAQPTDSSSYHDISIIPVPPSAIITTTTTTTTTPPTTPTTTTTVSSPPPPPPSTSNESPITTSTSTSIINETIDTKSNDLLTNLRQIGECTIQPVAK